MYICMDIYTHWKETAPATGSYTVYLCIYKLSVPITGAVGFQYIYIYIYIYTLVQCSCINNCCK